MSERNHPQNNAPAGQVAVYAAAAVMVAMSTLAGLAIAQRWGTLAVDLLFLPPVLGAAILGGLRPALASAVASALAYNFFFTAPERSLRVDSAADLVTVAVLFTVAVVASHLASSIRRQARIAEAHAARNATIAGLARRLLSCTSEQEIAQTAVEQLAKLLKCNAILLLDAEPPHIAASAPGDATLMPSDVAAAALTLSTGEPAGRSATWANLADWQFHPVRAKDTIIAAIGVARNDGAPPVPSDQLNLLTNLLDQVALALERARLESAARAFVAARERDRMRSALLATIGQDLKPGLARLGTTMDQLRRSGTGDKALVSDLVSATAGLDRYVAHLDAFASDSDREPVTAGSVTIDLFQRSVSRDGVEVHLTPKEFAVLAELAKQPGRVVTHAHLLRTVWGPAQESQTEYLRVAIRALRQKLEREPARPELIINEPAVGYRLAAGQAEPAPSRPRLQSSEGA
jgi:two-component system sensor histidine kinase KdpD